ncbi:MAG: EamA family transporter [Candidatus Pacebacteria bacterium]|nr:EamA family transporter [Candidatus Paceibacterota bacterium]
MHWFALALISPLLWGIVSHIDKFVISKYLEERGIGALLIFSSLFSIVVLPFLFLISKDIFSIPFGHILGLMLIGAVSIVAVGLSLYALEDNEASVVAPFTQLVPIFGYLFGFLILGETLPQNQIAASLIVIFGITILSFEFDEDKKIKFKKRLIALMIGSGLLFALYETFFKQIALNYNFFDAVFWQYVGLTITGICLFLFNKKYKSDFLYMLKTRKKIVTFAILFSELLVILGNVIFNFVSLLVPIALVFLVDSFQPLFVFIIGIILTIFFPHISKEEISGRHLAQKIIAIVIIFLGTYLLYL